MPAKSQQQLKYIYAMRNKYKSKSRAPKKMKWVFDEEWTKGVKMKNLPNKIKKESHVTNFRLFNESEFNLSFKETKIYSKFINLKSFNNFDYE